MKNIAIIALAIIAAGALAWSFSITDKALISRPAPATSAPTFKPDPETVAVVDAWLAQRRPWLEARSTDAEIPPGAAPATTFIVSRAEPVVVKDGDGWKITFKTP
jgi:hypothetical protein